MLSVILFVLNIT